MFKVGQTAYTKIRFYSGGYVMPEGTKVTIICVSDADDPDFDPQESYVSVEFPNGRTRELCGFDLYVELERNISHKLTTIFK